MSIVFDDTKWLTKRKGLGVDYMLVVNCGAGGVFKCSSREEALKVMEKARNNGCGYGLSVEDTHTKENKMEDFRATASDGSTWLLTAQEVVEDMIAREEPNYQWPSPLSRSVVLDYLQDNISCFKWQLKEPAVPGCYDLIVHED